MVVNLDTRDVVNPRNIQGFLNALPANVNDLPILIVRRESAKIHTQILRSSALCSPLAQRK